MLLFHILMQRRIFKHNCTANARRGFTLVELIVVLVILAILSALLIPALSGYIDKANERAVVTETRQAVVAAQTLVSESYALDGAEPTQQQIETLAEVPGQVYDRLIEQGKVTHLAYEHDDLNCIYCSQAKNGQPCSQCWAEQTYTVSKDEVSFYAYGLMSHLNDLCTTVTTGVWPNSGSNPTPTLNAYFTSDTRSIDSTAINETSLLWTKAVMAQLTAVGFDGNQGSWAMGANTTNGREHKYDLYYTPTVIDASMNGKSIAVTKYDPDSGVRVSGTAKVKKHTNYSYYIIDFGSFKSAD